MIPKLIFFSILTVIFSAVAFGQHDEHHKPPAGTVAPNIPGVVAGGTKVELIKDDYAETEGSIGFPDGSMVFTETKTSRLIRIDKDGKSSVFLENTNGSNGLGFDSKGRLISVQVTPGLARIGIIYPKGSEAVLADGYEGTPFTRPNDLVVDKKDGVYFTDSGPSRPSEATPGSLSPAVYYIPAGGKIIKVAAEGIIRPNGIQLSPDEKILYVNDWIGEYLVAFDVQTDGTVKNRRNLARYKGVMSTDRGVNSGADGLVVDSQGRLYSATNAGVEIFSPQGEHLGTIPIAAKPQNLAFAGSDKKTLYVVGHQAVFKIQMLAQGLKNRAK